MSLAAFGASSWRLRRTAWLAMHGMLKLRGVAAAVQEAEAVKAADEELRRLCVEIQPWVLKRLPLFQKHARLLAEKEGAVVGAGLTLPDLSGQACGQVTATAKQLPAARARGAAAAAELPELNSALGGGVAAAGSGAAARPLRQRTTRVGALHPASGAGAGPDVRGLHADHDKAMAGEILLITMYHRSRVWACTTTPSSPGT